MTGPTTAGWHGAKRFIPVKPPSTFHSGPQSSSSNMVEARLVFHVETPVARRLASSLFQLRGWCFDPSMALRRIRLRSDRLCVYGRYGDPRPDVKAAHPQAPEGTGFSVAAKLPPGDHTVQLQFEDATGQWQEAAAWLVTTRHGLLQACFARRWTSDDLACRFWAGASHPPIKLASERFPPPQGSTLSLAIVTPSYNQGTFLEQTIDSVLSQKAPGVTYQVVDGGSTDGTVELLGHHPHNALTWTSESDGGQADAIQKGFSRMRIHQPDIMAWINSDDYYLPGALQFVRDYFLKHPDVDVIYGHRILVDDESQEIGRWFLPAHDPEVLKLNDFVPQESMFWRRSLWEKAGGIDPKLSFAMDWDLLLRFQAAGAHIRRVPYFLACFRIHSAQKTSSHIHTVGQGEIDALRHRSFGRVLSPEEILNHPRLIRYLRNSAMIELLWRRFGIRL